MAHLHIILLEDKRLFLHTSTLNPNDKPNILLECELLYSYTQKYKPIRVQVSTKLQQDGEIDFFVKKYMKNYGIDNIRGGTYCREHLSMAERMIIMNEQNTTLHRVDDRTQTIETILAEHTEIGTWTPEQIHGELNALNISNDKFTHESNMLSKLSKFGDIIIDRSILDDLKWIGIKCIQQINPSLPFLVEQKSDTLENETPAVWDNIQAEINQQYMDMNSRDWLIPEQTIIRKHLDKATIDNYKRIVSKIKAVYNVFTDYTDIEFTYDLRIHMYNPNTMLDVFMYHADGVVDWTKHYSRLEKYINMCEYISYCIICKIDEYDFDVKSYSTNFDEVSSYKRRYLQRND